jgi:hypothetical protein
LLASSLAAASALGSIELMILWPVRSVTVNGVTVGVELPSGVSLRLTQDRCAWAYSDLFQREFRGRQQTNRFEVREQESEDLLHYAGGEPRPKVLLDLLRTDARDMHFNRAEDILWWTGALVYRFGFGFPVKSCRLQAPDGRPTVVGDWEWEKVGRKVEILASRDGEAWVPVWHSQEGGGGETPVDAEVPSQALGAPNLYLKFVGQSNNVIYDLFLSGELAVPGSVLKAALAAPDLQVRAEPAAEAVAVVRDGHRASTGEAPEARAEPHVARTGSGLCISLPGRTSIAFSLADDRLVGLGAIWLRGVQVSVPEPGSGHGFMGVEMVRPGALAPPRGWPAYLGERAALGQQWPSCGQVPVAYVELAGARLSSARTSGNGVRLVFSLDDERLQRVEWRFTPCRLEGGGEDEAAQGLDWQVTCQGGAGWRPLRLRLSYPVALRPGSTLVSQGWSRTDIACLSYMSWADLPASVYYGFQQPLAFIGGCEGSFIEQLSEPAAALAGLQQELAALRRTIAVPLREDGSAPGLRLFWDAKAVSDSQMAMDRYAELCDAQARRLMRPYFGNQWPPDPLPIAWDNEAWKALQAVRNGQTQTVDYLDRLAAAMPAAAALGLGELFVSGLIESDAEHAEQAYLPGSGCFGSTCAPWRLRVSPGLGGEAALRRLCQAAHDHGIKIIAWMTPAHYSNSSPVLVEHPEWIAWQADGKPGTCGYGDICGVSLRTPAFRYATQSYRRIRKSTALDGYWMDSYCTFGLLTDYAHGHPIPQLDRSLALQRELWRMGYRRLQIEACGPQGISSGGRGHAKGIEELRQRPAGAYRVVAFDVSPESHDFPMYFRCLANKCCLSLAMGDVAKVLQDGRVPADRERIAAANRAYLAALPQMVRRTLLGSRGVLWEGPRSRVIWAYSEFNQSFGDGSRATDLTTGETVATSPLQAQPWHIYVVDRP